MENSKNNGPSSIHIAVLVIFTLLFKTVVASDIDGEILTRFTSAYEEKAYSRSRIEKNKELIALVEDAKKRSRFKDVRSQFDDSGEFCFVSINMNYKLKKEKLPLFPLFSKNNATMASIESLKDGNFKSLPPEVKDSFQKTQKKTSDLIKKLNSGKISSDYFERETGRDMAYKNLPGILEKGYYLYDPNGSKKIRLTGIQYETYIDAGQYQINLKFENNDENALFVFDHGKDKEKIKIQKLSPVLKSGLFGFLPEPSTLVLLSENIYYIGSIYNSIQGYDIVFDSEKKKIISFNCYYGVSYGNERMNMVENYLLEYRGRKYLLRFNERRRFCEVLYFDKEKYKTFVHSDRTAPEI